MLSVIISWYNREELGETLPAILGHLESIGGDLTIVNFGGDKNLLNKQIGCYKNKVTIVYVHSSTVFNKPTAQNIGAYVAKQQYMFFCDCDILFTEPSLIVLLREVQNNPHSFGTLAKIKESKLNAREANNLTMFGYILRLKIADGTEVMIVDNEEDATDGTRQAPGLLLVNKKDFYKVNGYNSELNGWGWEDQDMICRLTLNTKLKRILAGEAIHVSHGDCVRMQGFTSFKDRWQSRDQMFRQALNNYNKGNLSGSYVEDVAKYSGNIEVS